MTKETTNAIVPSRSEKNYSSVRENKSVFSWGNGRIGYRQQQKKKHGKIWGEIKKF
jgi:hypothetical protein